MTNNLKSRANHCDLLDGATKKSHLLQVSIYLADAQNKPARVKVARDRNYLSGKAQRLFANERPLIISEVIL